MPRRLLVVLHEILLVGTTLDLIIRCIGVIIFHFKASWRTQIVLRYHILNIISLKGSERILKLKPYHGFEPMLKLIISKQPIALPIRTDTAEVSIIKLFVFLQ
jgi:hypothetical protein